MSEIVVRRPHRITSNVCPPSHQRTPRVFCVQGLVPEMFNNEVARSMRLRVRARADINCLGCGSEV